MMMGGQVRLFEFKRKGGVRPNMLFAQQEQPSPNEVEQPNKLRGNFFLDRCRNS